MTPNIDHDVSLKTDVPVVFLHGLFGWGRQGPWWNRFSYWPVEELERLNPNLLIVEMGIAASDHDRACEAFYQLFGGTVDYGEEHSKEADHFRYGETYDSPLHPDWGERNPVHLLGHSYGCTTAIELFQLICSDFFGVGSNHKWVSSITSIAGPLSGSTLSHLVGVSSDVSMHVENFSIVHLLTCGLGIFWRLQKSFPMLYNIYDIRMPQWRKHDSLIQIMSTEHPMHTSRDNVFHSLSPRLRVEKNCNLRHMDKLHLLSVVSGTPHRKSHRLVRPLLCLVFALYLGGSFGMHYLHQYFSLSGYWYLLATLVMSFTAGALALFFVPFKFRLMRLLQSRLKSHCSTLPDTLYEGFDKDLWSHNDGAVNTASMSFPRVNATESTGSRTHQEMSWEELASLGNEGSGLKRGHWHTVKVERNHNCGTASDRHATDLYYNLFRVLRALESQKQ